MNILLCCEFFYPNVGGAQEVVKQLAIRLVKDGNKVTVATSRDLKRASNKYKNIKIKSFNIFGNLSKGLTGDLSDYRSFVINGEHDLIFIYAAQQWTFDALVEILPKIKAKKVFVPCGFSGLYDISYASYYKQVIPESLRYFDAIIFHSKKYRDFRYVKNLRLKKLFFIPNGADNKEFASPSGSFRELFKIKEESKLLLTVGSLNPLKGHYDVAYAFSLIKYKSDVILVLNGNQQNKKLDNFTFELLRQLKKIFSGNFKLFAYLKRIFFKKNLLKLTDEINSGKFGYNKKVIILDMDRKNLINCYFDADLFVFASNIEYSPLVLFEAAAARLPFLTINVGNASEIIRWTRGGVLSNSEIDKDFFVHADVIDMAKKIDLLLLNSKKLNRLGQLGRKSHIKIYNWDNIFKLYNRIFVRLFNTKPRIFKK